MRTSDGESEVPLASYEHFASRDALSAVVLERMLAGVSTRRYARTQEPVGEEVERQARSTSESSVSRTFVARTAETLAELMRRRLDDVRLAVLMLDGIELKGRTNVVALGITTEGVKVPLGLGEGSIAAGSAVRQPRQPRRAIARQPRVHRLARHAHLGRHLRRARTVQDRHHRPIPLLDDRQRHQRQSRPPVADPTDDESRSRPAASTTS
jgi:hypothetical protein